ncbi:hypothetical protein ONZ51_g9184 [Trametes cubensis]|uniref:RING-CH-type domain-containing protein n=1 Tax=Trametes cubensis TaxID=1111947 RepID=A0AAD7TNP6_9APHY|nr:hypothetical protein ONZ51_g9184 [Trametes cubensis]
MAAAQVDWVPTVDDLRVKSCYICREEEQFDNPEDPPRAWTHPCSCTLIAHESCLLQWIQSAQQDASRASKALKCPQCGAQYELESDNPLILRALNALNGVLSSIGKVGTFVGFFGLVASVGCTIWVVSTTYGAFAVKEFLGKEAFDTFLTDDPSKWPWHAFIYLPIIPVSLILSRTRLFDTSPILPLLVVWASSPPVDASLTSFASFHPSFRSFLGLAQRGASSSASGLMPALNWPPTPLMAMILFPIVRSCYRRAFDTLTQWVMGGTTDPDAYVRGRVRRIVWALNGDEGPIRVRVGANIERAGGEDGAQGQGANDAAARNAARRGAGDAQEGEDEPEDPAAAAERTLHVSTSSLGRFIGGALLVPTISKYMGALLYRLSRHSTLLRALLAIRDRPATPAPSPMRFNLFQMPPNGPASTFSQAGRVLATGFNILCGGTPTWNALDPVWWRNAVGLGIFVFTKDCIRLLHLWLTKRELQSRRVKSRPFAGVDIQELDLIPRPDAQPASQASDPTVATASITNDSAPTSTESLRVSSVS